LCSGNYFLPQLYHVSSLDIEGVPQSQPSGFYVDRLQCEVQLIPFPEKVARDDIGRLDLVSRFLQVEIRRDVRANPAANSVFAADVLDTLTSICSALYDKSRDSLDTFTFKDTDLSVPFQDTQETLEEVLLNAELLRQKPGEPFKFADHSLDDYFVSRILRKQLESDPQKAQLVLPRQNFYSQTEVLPFLVGQYDRIDFIFPQIIQALVSHKSTVDLQTYLASDFLLCFLHVRRTPANLAFLESFDPQLPSMLKNELVAKIRKLCCGSTMILSGEGCNARAQSHLDQRPPKPLNVSGGPMPHIRKTACSHFPLDFRGRGAKVGLSLRFWQMLFSCCLF